MLIASERPVKLGPSEGDLIAILSGLEENERIVEGPYRVLKTLKDGDTVTAMKDDKKDDKQDDKQDDSPKDKGAKKGEAAPDASPTDAGVAP